MKVYGFRCRNGEFEEVLYHVETVNSQFKNLVFTGHISLFLCSLNYVHSKEKIRNDNFFFLFKIHKRQFEKLKELWDR